MDITDAKISVIIPVYNGETHLSRCIESVRMQTHKNLQIILIDDGSMDNSLVICQQFAQLDPRIEVYHTENRGLVAARKYGLTLATGAYIGFTDADDYIDAEMFYILLQKIIETDADFVHSGYIEEIGDIQKNVYDFDESIINMGDTYCRNNILKKYILGRKDENYISSSIWSKLFKREFIKKCYSPLPNEQQYGEDLLCLCRCILESHRIVLIKKAMYHYVIGENTLSHLKYDEYMIKEVRLWNCFINILQEYNCYEFLKDSAYYFLKNRMIDVISADSSIEIPIPQFYYKDLDLIRHKKIVIFGAGKVGRDYYTQISKYQYCEIVAWIDSNWYEYHFDYAEVVNIEKVLSIQWDLVIIAVKDKVIGMEIMDLLVKMGVDIEKINWQEPGQYY